MSAQIQPPPKPDKLCPVCQQPSDFRLRDGWESLRFAATSSTVAGFIAYEHLPHPACADRERALLEAQAAQEKAADEEAHRQQLLTEWREHNQFGKGLEVRRFETFVTSEENRGAFECVKAWRRDDDFGLLIIGPSGTGKSHLALAVCQVVAEEVSKTPDGHRKPLPVYTTASHLLATVKKENFTLPWRALSSSLFVLDDLGSENITDWSREVLFSLFDERWSKRYPTIVTTNLTLNELRERLHERTVSRILGLCVPIVFTGKDYRHLETAERMKILRARAQGSA